MDDDLSARARKLVEVAMAQDVPPDDVVEDSWGMVISRVTADTEREDPPDLPTVAAIEGARGRAWGKIAVAVVVVLLAAAAIWIATRPPAEAEAPTPTRAGPRAGGPRPDEAEPERAKPAVKASATGLLEEADGALATEPARALALLDRHAALAPTIDAERRMALRILALCGLDRRDEAEAETKAFFRVPRTPAWSARVRASCASAAAPEVE